MFGDGRLSSEPVPVSHIGLIESIQLPEGNVSLPKLTHSLLK
jgi:hypothetical protein